MPPARKPAAKAEPVTDPDKLLAELRRPFSADAVKWKVQTNPKARDKSTLVVGYIDARLVAERLNHVCPGRWSDTYLPLAHNAADNGVRCRIRIALDGDNEIVREDIGTFPPGVDDIRIKGGYSDAFKRAGVKFGIGSSIYATPQMWLPPNMLDIKPKGEKFQAYLTDRSTVELARRYDAWLKEHAIEHFGEVLAHGETLAEQGDVEVKPTETTVPEGDPARATTEDMAGELETLRQALSAAKVKGATVKNHLTAQYGVQKVADVPHEKFEEFSAWVTKTIAETPADG